MKKLVYLLVFFTLPSFGQVYYFEVCFKDKTNSNYSISSPTQFLSEKAILRREKHNIPIINQDLPINDWYLDSVSKWVKLEANSKWFNLTAISTLDSGVVDSIKNYPFVKSIKYIGKNIIGSGKTAKSKWLNETNDEAIDYGNSAIGIQQVTGDYLHQKGFLGEGKLIAVLDAGFINVDNMSIFSHLFLEQKIIASKNFVNPLTNVFSTNNHGTMVLSVLAGMKKSEIYGSAPNANYVLLLTEDVNQENMIEEYYWVNAAEYSDSIGADVINSSLGYYEFDTPSLNHNYQELDGNTTIISKAANLAFEKGMLIFNSAGNEGNSSWNYIVFPADAKNVIAVGGVNANGERSNFSSKGYDFPNQVKPNIVGLATSAYVQSNENSGTFSNGTSFSNPLLCGLTACLWQAYPGKSNQEIKDMLQQSAHQFLNPDSLLGFGIPNFKKAYIQEIEKTNLEINQDFIIYPNPIVGNQINIEFKNPFYIFYSCKIFATNGELILERQISNDDKISEYSYNFYTSKLAQGIYYIQIQTDKGMFYDKIFFESSN